MVIQKRWLCQTCQREWVHAQGWTPADGCPGCHSSQVSQVEYAAAFAGGDIPRGPAPAAPGRRKIRVIADAIEDDARAGAVIQAPPLTLEQS